MSDERGQIALDFAIGASLFLLALVFAAIFIPTLISPFIAGGGQANDIAAERIASNLAWQLQDEEEGVTALESACTEEFFDDTASYSNCHASASGDRLDIITEGPNTRVNVTLRDASDGSVENSIGPDASVTGSGYASRPVRMDGTRYTLVVEVY